MRTKGGPTDAEAGDEAARPKSVIPYSREKPRVERDRRPYRKPTQVGEERILRRLREPWSRN